MTDMRPALLAARPDLEWFVAPERVYSINDNPNTLRVWAGRIMKAIIAGMMAAGVASYIYHGGV